MGKKPKVESEELDERLFAAARRGSAFGVSQCLRAGASVKLIQTKGRQVGKCPVLVAAAGGRMGCFMAVWNEAGETVRRAKICQSLLVLGYRAWREDPEAFKSVTGQASGLGVEEKELRELFFTGLLRGSEGLAMALAPRFGKSRTKSGTTALMLAAERRGGADAVAMLLPHSDKEARDENGATALLRAAACSALEPVKVLLAAGASLASRDDGGSTALMVACDASFGTSVVEELLRAGADVDARDAVRRTALIRAASAGADGSALALLEAGANAEARDEDGLAALDYARKERSWPSGGHLIARLESILECAMLDRGVAVAPSTQGVRKMAL